MQNRIDLSASTRSFPLLFSFYAFGTIIPILVETSNSKLLHPHMNLMGLTITICSSNIPCTWFHLHFHRHSLSSDLCHLLCQQLQSLSSRSSHAYVLSCFSHVWLFVTPWTVAHQTPLSMGFFRQEYWSGLPFPPPGDLPEPEIEPAPLTSPALAGRLFTTSTPWEA